MNSMPKGLIIIGYPGIGKSSIVKGMNFVLNSKINLIDFESSLFNKTTGIKYPDWHIVYVNQAISMAKQGYVVLISSHECVREEIAKRNRDEWNVVTIAPSVELKDEWLEKLLDRYKRTATEKDSMAYRAAKEHYTEDVLDISAEENMSHITLETMEYDLSAIVEYLVKIFTNM